MPSWIASLLLAASLPPVGTQAIEPPPPGVLRDRYPAPILRVEGKPRNVIVVEKDIQTLHLFHFDGEAKLVATYPCTTGKNLGDKAIVGDERIEIPITQNWHHDIDIAGRQADGIGQTLFLDLEQFSQCAIRACYLINRCCMLRIVQVQKRNTVEPKGGQALFQGTPSS